MVLEICRNEKQSFVYFQLYYVISQIKVSIIFQVFLLLCNDIEQLQHLIYNDEINSSSTFYIILIFSCNTHYYGFSLHACV